MNEVEFASTFWYWAIGLILLFLPVEVFAAVSKLPGWRGGTFSEFIWWAFGIRPRPGGKPVRYAAGRHVVLVGMCASLLAHFGFSFSVIPVVVFGAPCGVVLVRAVLWERQ